MVRSCPELNRIHRGPARPELKEGKSYLVVYVGVMGPQDGLDLLLEAIEHIVKRSDKLRGSGQALQSEVSDLSSPRDDTLFVLIGAGTELARLQTLAAAKGLESVVKFTGRIPDDALAAYLSTADVCVAPDPRNPMNDKSTMNKILEYMAYGRPVVLFDLTEGRRSAADAALYARPNDPQDFAEQILKLLDSESLRRQLGEIGHKRIQESLNWGIEKNALLEAYSNVTTG